MIVLRLVLQMRMVFINENLCRANSKLVFHCKNLKRDSHIEKTCTRNGIAYFQHDRVCKMLHITTLFNLFPDFGFGDDYRDEEHSGSLQSIY